MSDEFETTSAPEPAEPSDPTPPPADASEPAAADATPGPSASEAWAEVVSRMGELSTAVAAWAKAAADNPENRRRLDEVKNGVNDMAKQADAAFAHVTSSDFGQQVKSGAEEAGAAIGDAAQKVSEAAAPHVATAFAGLAGMFGKAAEKVEEAAQRQRTAAEPSAEPAAEEAAAAEPAAPAEPSEPESTPPAQ